MLTQIHLLAQQLRMGPGELLDFARKVSLNGTLAGVEFLTRGEMFNLATELWLTAQDQEAMRSIDKIPFFAVA